MKKTVWIVGCAAGVFLMILSVAMTVHSINVRINEGIGIIGGADWPTFEFFFRTKCIWLVELGVVTVVISVIGLLWKKKNK